MSNTRAYEYRFAKSVPMGEVADSLLLAVLSVEAVFGEARVLLDVAHCLDVANRVCTIDASTCVGRVLNKVFTNYLRYEFGKGAFAVQRLTATAASA